MKDRLSFILNIVLVALLVISSIIGIIVYVAISQLSSDAEFAEMIANLGVRLNLFLNWSYFLVIATAVAAIIFPLIKMAVDPTHSKKTLIMLGGFVVVAILAYLIASDEIPKFPGSEKFFSENLENDPHTLSKNIDTGLMAMYILGLLSIFSIIYYEVAKLFK